MLLALLELAVVFESLLLGVALFGPYILGILFCGEGAFPFTNDCVALVTGSPSVTGTIVTIVVQVCVTVIGFWYALRLVLKPYRENATKPQLLETVSMIGATVLIAFLVLLGLFG